MSAAGLLCGRFLCCEVGLGLRGKGGRDWRKVVLLYLCCVISLLFCCVCSF